MNRCPDAKGFAVPSRMPAEWWWPNFSIVMTGNVMASG